MTLRVVVKFTEVWGENVHAFGLGYWFGGCGMDATEDGVGRLEGLRGTFLCGFAPT